MSAREARPPSRAPGILPSALERLAAAELHRASAGFLPDAGLLADGWEYRFVADGGRAAESAALYQDLGFEVCDAAVGAAAAPACADCRLVALLKFRAIYTRRRSTADTA